MDDPSDEPERSHGPVEGPHVDDPPVITCRRCGREWDLAAELDTVGNQAFEQFALDHRRHTGHFPDGVATWRVACRHCPEETERLSETAAVRFAETHARHTSHDLEVRHATDETVTVVEGDRSTTE